MLNVENTTAPPPPETCGTLAISYPPAASGQRAVQSRSALWCLQHLFKLCLFVAFLLDKQSTG